MSAKIHIIEIDPYAGFCSGVKKAISSAEEALEEGPLCSLGSIVHNDEEVLRLERKGMKTISADDLAENKGKKVFLRTHGEPPETYLKLKAKEFEYIDATCPVVKKLQERVKKATERVAMEKGQVVIYGKKNHAEVIGLIGHSEGKALVIENRNDLEQIDCSRPVEIFSQTTMKPEGLEELKHLLEERITTLGLDPSRLLKIHNTICRQVSGREETVKAFASRHDVILFVSGRKSSNGAMLYAYACEVNPHSYRVSGPADVQKEWLSEGFSIGITGATSTPPWLMEEVRKQVKVLLQTE